MCIFRMDMNQSGKFINLESNNFQQSSYMLVSASIRERSGKMGSGEEGG